MIFLSHAAADHELVEVFETLLTKALSITSEDIFCSSLEGQGAKKGASFVDEIKSKAQQAGVVVALISPAYMESSFCLAELGAAWVLNTHRFPIVVPPNTFEVMQASLFNFLPIRSLKKIFPAKAGEFVGPAGIALISANFPLIYLDLAPELSGWIGLVQIGALACIIYAMHAWRREAR